MAEKYVSPYAAQILKETLGLREAENAPAGEMFTEDEKSKRRAKQYYDEQLAIALKMSGDKGLESVGASLLPEALKARTIKYAEHGEYDPMSGSLRVFPEVGRQRDLTRRQKEIDMLEQKQLADEAREREARLREEERRTRAAAPNPYREAATAHMKAKTAALEAEKKEGKPLVGSQFRVMEAVGKDLDAIDKVANDIATKFNPNSPKPGTSRIEALKDWAVREAPGVTAAMKPEWVANQEAWASVQRLVEMKARHANFGATLSGNEKKSWDEVTPPRGIGRDKLIEWVGTQRSLIERAATHTADALAAGGANRRQLEILTRGRWKPPKPAEVPPPSVGGQTFNYDPATGDVL